MNAIRKTAFAAVFAAAALSGSAMAADPVWTFADLGDGTLKVVSVDAKGAALLYVPAISEGASVASVAAGAFAADCANLTAVVLPKQLRAIDENAFVGCPTLLELYVPVGATFGIASLWLPSACHVIYYDASANVNPASTTPPTVRYSVTFYPNGGTGKKFSQQFICGTAQNLARNVFKKKGCVFAGWSAKPTGPVLYENAQSVLDLAGKPGANVKLYAQWAVKYYHVSFFPSGATGKMAKQKFTYGKAKALRANAFKFKGHTFLGWGKKSGSAVKYQDAQVVRNLRRDGKTVKLYAKWRTHRYTVRFDPNGGTGTMADEAFKWGKKKKLSACAFKKSKCIFIGWATSPKGKVVYADAEKVKNLTAKDGKVLTLYARWAVKYYTVHFDANGGKGSMADQTFTYNKTKALRRNAFTKGTDIFVGWAKTPDAKKARYYDAQKVANLSAKGKTVTLYAVWQLKCDPNVILCAGDSITAGIRCSGDPYPTRLQRLCGKTVINKGVGGVTSWYGADHIQKYLNETHPGTVCILYGANDARREKGLSMTINSLRSIIRTCKAYGARPLIATPTPQLWDHSDNTQKMKEMASAVRSLARSEGVTLVDLHSAFGDGSNYLNREDGLHLNNAGGDLMARMFYNAL